MSERSRPVLLVFTLGAFGDRARRPLVPARLAGAEVELRRSCFEAALAAGREAGCRLAVCSPRPLTCAAPGVDSGDSVHLEQRGSGFGGRFERALAAAFDLAAGAPVVAVGSDAPGLTADHVRAALDRLVAEPDRVVAGPSPDGGFYLLAAARPVAGLAAGVRWCRRDALASLRRLLADQGRELALLARLADLDRPVDLDRWLARGIGGRSAWRRRVRALLTLLARLRLPPAPARLGRPRLAFAAVAAGRGPPAS